MPSLYADSPRWASLVRLALDAAAEHRLNAESELLKGKTMDIHLDKRAVRQIRLSAQEAIEEGDTDALREDILDAFTEEQVEEIERRLDNGDFYEFLTDVLDEWGGDDVEELFELLETQLGEVGIDLKTDLKSGDEEEEDDEPDLDDDEPDEDLDDDVLDH